MTTLSQLGEFSLIERIKARANKLRAPDIVTGIGDDAAVLRPRAGEDLVVSTDALVEDVHFRFRNQSPATIGRRALLVNLSDLAAMGARPVGFTLAMCAPAKLSVAKVDALIEGLLREAATNQCPLIGGNLSRAQKTTLSVTILGAVPRGKGLLRSAARPGDRIFVTGTVGGAGIALQTAEKNDSALRHLPTPRVATGRALLRSKYRGACIDLSDGIAADLRHVVEASNVGAEVDPSRLPTPRGFANRCGALGLDPAEVALRAGEDYELLFTMRRAWLEGTKSNVAALSKQLGAPVTEIGHIVKAAGIRGLPDSIQSKGFRHFRA